MTHPIDFSLKASIPTLALNRAAGRLLDKTIARLLAPSRREVPLDPHRFSPCWAVVNQARFFAGQIFWLQFNPEMFGPSREDLHNWWDNYSHLANFGYGYVEDENLWLILPDREALEERVRTLYPEFKVLSIEDDLEDLEIAKAYCQGYDVFLHSGKNFVQHHASYVLPTLDIIVSNPQEYYQARSRLEKIVRQMCNRVEKLEKLMKPEEIRKLKVIVDAFTLELWEFTTLEWMRQKSSEMERAPHQFPRIKEILFRSLWVKKFGEEPDFEALQALWQRSISLTSPRAKL